MVALRNIMGDATFSEDALQQCALEVRPLDMESHWTQSLHRHSCRPAMPALVMKLIDAQLLGLQAKLPKQMYQRGRNRLDIRGSVLELHVARARQQEDGAVPGDRKSTRLNSRHTVISYAVFCLKKKTRTGGAGWGRSRACARWGRRERRARRRR